MDKENKIIYLAGNKMAYDLKAEFREFMKERGHKIVDLGVFKDDESKFEDIRRELDEKVNEEDNAMGILVFGKE